MPVEVWSVVIGTGMGFFLSGVLTVWLHAQQSIEADQDWHRDNQRDIDWRVQDVLIDIQAFVMDPYAKEQSVFTDSMAKYHHVFNRARAVQLLARLDAYRVRLKDDELFRAARQIRIELMRCIHDGNTGRETEGLVVSEFRLFNKRIADLYGGENKREALADSKGAT